MAIVLVVDDDANFRQLASLTLNAAGHTVLEAARCSAAVAVLRNHKPDLLVVDGLLPDGDGAAWVKNQRAGGMTIPVLYVSAFRRPDVEQQELLREAGIEASLVKPATAPELLTKVERVLHNHGIERVEEVWLGEAELQALEQMRAQYASDLPGVIAALQTSVRQLAASPASTALQGVARRRAHQLAGTAGSFGFGPVGDACAKLEQAIVALQAGGPFAPVEAALEDLVFADFPELA